MKKIAKIQKKYYNDFILRSALLVFLSSHPLASAGFLFLGKA
jgi:hypothetical protein